MNKTEYLYSLYDFIHVINDNIKFGTDDYVAVMNNHDKKFEGNFSGAIFQWFPRLDAMSNKDVY